MTRKNFVGGMLAFGLISAATISPLAAQVPGVPVPSLGISIGVKASTLGLGVEVGKKILPRINARVGINYAKATADLAFSSLDYSIDLKLTSVPVLLDLYLLGPIRASAGLVYNKNQITLSLDPTTAVTVGSQTFQASDIGTISGTVGFAKKVAPYIGLGIGGRGKVGFILELGAMFPGDIALTYTGTTTPSAPAAVVTAFQTQITAEKTQLETDINSKSYVKIWPVIGIGLQITI